jgi:ribonuclease-3
MGGRAKESVLATALEAVVGVIYLEGGLEACRRAIAALAVW